MRALRAALQGIGSLLRGEGSTAGPYSKYCLLYPQLQTDGGTSWIGGSVPTAAYPCVPGDVCPRTLLSVNNEVSRHLCNLPRGPRGCCDGDCMSGGMCLHTSV